MSTRRAFTLLELLVVVAVIGTLLSLMLPSLAAARGTARQAGCTSNLRQLVLAWTLYAGDYGDRAMPLAYTDPGLTRGGDSLYWWGSDGSASGRVDSSRGFLTPYLADSLRERSVFECPAQPWGSYRPQGAPREFTSTYGYNGYYLCPPHTPGWSSQIGRRPWRRLADIAEPTRLLVFGDTLLEGSPPSSNALLDPPMLFDGTRWVCNDYPTLCFRHPGGAACTGRADGSAAATRAEPGWIAHTRSRTGSLGLENDPHHVPDWEEWR